MHGENVENKAIKLQNTEYWSKENRKVNNWSSGASTSALLIKMTIVVAAHTFL